MPESRKRQKEAPATPRFPSEQRRCRYCKLMFKTKPTYNGSKMKFCSERHRKAFDKEGEKPIDVILRKQERRMRQIAREEIAAQVEKFEYLRRLFAETYAELPRSPGPIIRFDQEGAPIPPI